MTSRKKHMAKPEVIKYTIIMIDDIFTKKWEMA